MIIDPFPVFMKNLQYAKNILQLWSHNRQLQAVHMNYTEQPEYRLMAYFKNIFFNV